MKCMAHLLAAALPLAPCLAAAQDGMPDGWMHQTWNGFLPRAAVATSVEDGATIIHISDVKGPDGAGIVEKLRKKCGPNDIVRVKYSARGRGKAFCRVLRSTAAAKSCPNLDDKAIDLTDEWQTREFTTTIGQAPIGVPAMCTAGIACTKGSEVWFKDVSWRLERQYYDDFERDSAGRAGSPERIVTDVAPGLLESTHVGVYRTDSVLSLPLGDGGYVLPPEGELNPVVEIGARIYAFGHGDRRDGRVAFGLSSNAGGCSLLVDHRASAPDLECSVADASGAVLGRLQVPVAALPADFALRVARAGSYDVSVRSLADSSSYARHGEVKSLSGSSEPLSATFRLERTGAGEAVVAIDNLTAGRGALVAKSRPVPLKVEALPEFDPVKAGWPLVFSDEFDGEKIDEAKWTASNPSRDWRTKRCAFVKDGLLHIVADWNKDHTRLESTDLWSTEKFRYGYFEARLRFTQKNGWWAAFWLYGKTNSNPFDDGFEIDIFEDYYTRDRDPKAPRKGILDHNLHVSNGPQLKSWNYNSRLPGSLDDFYVIGCRWTPFEISYYLNGKLIASKAAHSDYRSVTFDAVSHAAGLAPLHVVFNGNIMRDHWTQSDKTGVEFPEHYLVDYVRVYAYPDDPGGRPSIALTGIDPDYVLAARNSRQKFKADVRPAEGTKSPVRAVYLFDNGYLLDYRTEPPYAFDVEFSGEYFDKTRFMLPGRSGVRPVFDAQPHYFSVFAQDESGRVSHTEPFVRFVCDISRSEPYEGRAQAIPGDIRLGRFDAGGPGVAYRDVTPENTVSKTWRPKEGPDCGETFVGSVGDGEWLVYSVDVAKAGRYSATLCYGTPRRDGNSLDLIVDGRRAGRFECRAHAGKDWSCDTYSRIDGIELSEGRHKIMIYFRGRFNCGGLKFELENQGVVADSLPSGWGRHEWEGYLPLSKVTREAVNGKQAICLRDARGRDGTGILSLPREECRPGDVLYVTYSVCGRGKGRVCYQLFTDGDEACDGGSDVARDLTDDWKTYTYVGSICDSKIGDPRKFSVGLACPKGSEACFADVSWRLERQFSDDYEAASPNRAGNPRIVSGDVAPGLIETTHMGLYSTSSRMVVPLGGSGYRLPATNRVESVLETSFRLYALGGGRLTLSLSSAAGGVSFAAVQPDGEDSIACALADSGGARGEGMRVRPGALPADFVVTLSRSGRAKVVVKSLADSSTAVCEMESQFLKGCELPLSASIVLESTGSAEATATLDNLSAGRVRPAEETLPTPPFKIDAAAEFDPAKAGWPLVFADEFDGERIDETKWSAPAEWNIRDWRTTDGAFVKDGILHIKTDWNKEHTRLATSGLRSVGKFGYGYYEARLRFTQKNGWWAAFWLYGKSNTNPFLDGFEIDIFEDYYTRDRDPKAPRKGILDHNLHVNNGRNLKSWNYNSRLPGSLDEFYRIGCKWTPFEISYYLDGRLIASKSTHSAYRSVTFDAFAHAAGFSPLHIIFNGNIMRDHWRQSDKTGVEFPEHYLVDYVRYYAYPDDPADRPSIGVEVDDDRTMVPEGSPLRVSADVKPAANTKSAIKAVYLFDNGYLVDFKTEPPYVFDMEFSKRYFGGTRFMRAGRSGKAPVFGEYAPHLISVFAQDEGGRVAHSEPFLRLVGNAQKSRPFRGEAQKIPGEIKVGRYDEGGEGVAWHDTSPDRNRTSKTWRAEEGPDCTEKMISDVGDGEWLVYSVDIAKAGRYRATLRYGTPRETHGGLLLMVDGRRVGEIPCHEHEERSWTPDTVSTVGGIALPAGRHRLAVYCGSRFSFDRLEFAEE